MLSVASELQLTDQALIADAQTGSVRAFEILVLRYHPQILRYLTRQVGDRELAADLIRRLCLRPSVTSTGSRTISRSRPDCTGSPTTPCCTNSAGAARAPSSRWNSASAGRARQITTWFSRIPTRPSQNTIRFSTSNSLRSSPLRGLLRN